MIFFCGCGEAVDVDDDFLADMPPGRTFTVACLGCLNNETGLVDSVVLPLVEGAEGDVLDSGSEGN